MCLFVCLSACLSVCPPACLPACLSVCPSNCLSDCLLPSLTACVCACLRFCLFVRVAELSDWVPLVSDCPLARSPARRSVRASVDRPCVHLLVCSQVGESCPMVYVRLSANQSACASFSVSSCLLLRLCWPCPSCSLAHTSISPPVRLPARPTFHASASHSLTLRLSREEFCAVLRA